MYYDCSHIQLHHILDKHLFFRIKLVEFPGERDPKNTSRKIFFFLFFKYHIYYENERWI